MSIAKKGRRKLVRNDKVYYWSVKDSKEDDRFYLTIVSNDKKFIVKYMLNQRDKSSLFSPKNPLIVVMGKEFKGRNDVGKCCKMFFVPDWEDEIITHRIVGEIIDWCYMVEDVTELDYKGQILVDKKKLN